MQHRPHYLYIDYKFRYITYTLYNCCYDVANYIVLIYLIYILTISLVESRRVLIFEFRTPDPMSPMKAQVINQPVIAVTSFPSTGFNITSSKPSTAQQRRQKFQAVSTLSLNAFERSEWDSSEIRLDQFSRLNRPITTSLFNIFSRQDSFIHKNR